MYLAVVQKYRNHLTFRRTYHIFIAQNDNYVLLSHLDCDHANGLKLVADSKNILVSSAEMNGTKKHDFQTRIRFQKRWWDGTRLSTFDWNGKKESSLKLFL